MRWLMSLRIAGVLTVALTDAAIACVPPPPPVRFSSETDQDYAARAKIVFEDSQDEDRRARQVWLFENARSIHLARVATTAPVAIEGWGEPVRGHAITAKTIRTIKGDQPDSPLAMADRSMSSCGIGGGGPATSEPPGALILVFTDVPIGGGRQHFGLPIAAVREPRLMAALDKAAISLRDATTTEEPQ